MSTIFHRGPIFPLRGDPTHGTIVEGPARALETDRSPGKAHGMHVSDDSYPRDAEYSPGTSTSASLLDQVKHGDATGWQRLMSLYRPLVLWWCRNRVARHEDAEDVVQEVLATVMTRIGEFDRQRPGSFRAWLKAITQFKLMDYWKAMHHQPMAAGGSEAKEALDQYPARPLHEDGPDVDASERRILLRSALELLQPEFEPKTWAAALKAVEGQPAAGIAADLGMTRDAVYIAKSRVLARLRKEMVHLLE
jgi:RNA polymerase sigma-70 factor (ECF subfamily)